jgi:hypothetical protein
MPTYRAIWPDVPQYTVSGEDPIDVLARAGVEFESFTSDPEDDPNHVSPVLTWVVGWDGDKRVMRLRADGNATDVHVCEVAAPPERHALTRAECSAAGHPMAFYRPARNDSVCACNEAMKLGDYRASVKA